MWCTDNKRKNVNEVPSLVVHALMVQTRWDYRSVFIQHEWRIKLVDSHWHPRQIAQTTLTHTHYAYICIYMQSVLHGLSWMGVVLHIRLHDTAARTFIWQPTWLRWWWWTMWITRRAYVCARHHKVYINVIAYARAATILCVCVSHVFSCMPGWWRFAGAFIQIYLFFYFSLTIRFGYDIFRRTSSLNCILFSIITCATFAHSAATVAVASSFAFTSLIWNECYGYGFGFGFGFGSVKAAMCVILVSFLD